jgi:excisionase family DNA binding protein
MMTTSGELGIPSLSTDRYLTVQEVASRLVVCPHTVYKWIDAGTLRALRLPGGQYRVSLTVMQRFEREQITSTS